MPEAATSEYKLVMCVGGGGGEGGRGDDWNLPTSQYTHVNKAVLLFIGVL